MVLLECLQLLLQETFLLFEVGYFRIASLFEALGNYLQRSPLN